VLVAQLQVREVQDLDRAKVGRLVNGGLEVPELGEELRVLRLHGAQVRRDLGAVTAIVSSLQALLEASRNQAKSERDRDRKRPRQAQDILEDVFLEMGIELRAQLKRVAGEAASAFWAIRSRSSWMTL